MTARKKWIAAALAIAAAVALVWHMTLPTSDEPTYEGKTVTQWIDATRDGGSFEFVYDSDPAFLAIVSMGSNAVPSLLHHWTNRQSQTRMERFRDTANRNSLIDRKIKTNEERADRAHTILIRLGTNAANAVPFLVETLRTDRHQMGAAAADVLGRIGSRPDLAVPALIDSLSSPKPNIRWFTVIALGGFRKEAQPALPHLRPFLQSTNLRTAVIAVNAAISICQIDPEDSDEARSVLLRSVAQPTSQTTSQPASQAIFRLADLGPAAVWALPALEKRLNDPRLGDLILRAIKKIDPERWSEITGQEP
jgi:HEAT repeat protein